MAQVSKISECRLTERDYVNTSNVLTLRMSGEQIRLQVPPKLFGVHSWTPQMNFRLLVRRRRYTMNHVVASCTFIKLADGWWCYRQV